MIKIATDCSGIGSPEQALKNLGVPHEIVFACERDKYARQTYTANFTPGIMFEDMTKRDNSPPNLHSELYAAGIPCQAFSLAGKRLGELDPRGLLFYNFYDYVKKQKPKAFIIENVIGLLSDNKGRTFKSWLELLSSTVNYQHNLYDHPDSLGYNVHYSILNSVNFGVPQNRERIFIVGIRQDLPNVFKFDKGEPLKKRLKDVLEKNVPEKYFLSEKMLEYFRNIKANFNGGKWNLKFGDDIASCITASSSHLDISDNLIVVGEVTPNSQMGKVYDPEGIFPTICAGTHGYCNPYIIQKSDERLRGELFAKDICPTLKSETHGGDSQPLVVINGRIRRLTPLECFRLQAFPDEFVKPCSDTQLYKQAGNSITVYTMQSVIKNLLPIIQ